MKIYCLLGLSLVGTIEACCEVESTLQLGGNYTYADIQVSGQPSFHGNLGGVQGSYELQTSCGFYGALKGAWKTGETKGSFAKRQLTYVDGVERLGYTYIPDCQPWSFTLFSGFGYRYISHKLQQEGQPAIRFNYNEFYVPVGFLGDYFFNGCFSLGLDFTWMPQVYPTVEIVPLRGARWVLTNTTNNFLVELPFSYFFDNCFSLILKPFYEHWKDGRSTAVTATGNALGLPSNNYNFYGLELNVAYTF